VERGLYTGPVPSVRRRETVASACTDIPGARGAGGYGNGPILLPAYQLAEDFSERGASRPSYKGQRSRTAYR